MCCGLGTVTTLVFTGFGCAFSFVCFGTKLLSQTASRFSPEVAGVLRNSNELQTIILGLMRTELKSVGRKNEKHCQIS